MTVPPAYSVKTATFEGPLDLLLHLIEKRKLFINDITLGTIADDYIAYVQTLEHLPIADTAHFILVASALLLIKSRSLLPELALTSDEQSDIMRLEARLKVFQEIRRMAGVLHDAWMKHPIFFRPASIPSHPLFVPHASMTSKNLHATALSLIMHFPKQEALPTTIVKKMISLEETIKHLAERVQQNLTTRFREFAGIGKREKIEVVVSFLAMLELVKQGLILVRQISACDDIEMESTTPSVPNYTTG